MESLSPTEDQRLARTTLVRRHRAALRLLRRCRLCELRCDVNRLAGERGPCRLTAETRVYKQYVSFNEEPELLPALRVFLSACNFRCTFCDEAPHAFDPHDGKRVDPQALADELGQAATRGVRTISILGGEPSLHVHTILAVAEAADNKLPIALNTNMYMTPVVLELLDGVVRWYLADFKFGDDLCAQRVAGISDYVRIVRRNLVSAVRRADVIVRHLLLPGHLDCCFRPIVTWLSDHLAGVRFQLYPGYVPIGSAAADPILGRLNTRADVARAIEMLKTSSLRWQTPVVERRALPKTDACRSKGTASITIGKDGRVYCHDLSQTLLPVLAAISPHDSALAYRARTENG